MSAQIPFRIHIPFWVPLRKRRKVSLYPCRGQHCVWIAPCRSVGRLVGSVRVRSGWHTVTIGFHLCRALVRQPKAAASHLRLRPRLCRAIRPHTPPPCPLPLMACQQCAPCHHAAAHTRAVSHMQAGHTPLAHHSRKGVFCCHFCLSSYIFPLFAHLAKQRGLIS